MPTATDETNNAKEIISTEIDFNDMYSFYKQNALKNNNKNQSIDEFISFIKNQPAASEPSVPTANSQQQTGLFDQGELIRNVEQEQEQEQEQDNYKTLYKFVMEYDGLCELIANYVIMKNLLGNSNDKIDLNKDSFMIKTKPHNVIELQMKKPPSSAASHGEPKAWASSPW